MPLSHHVTSAYDLQAMCVMGDDGAAVLMTLFFGLTPVTTPLKTQCPHCQACFEMAETQSDKADATVRCDQCQQSFWVKQNLIVSPSASSAQKNMATHTNDKMATTETHKSPSSATHSEGMNAWLAQMNDLDYLDALSKTSAPTDSTTGNQPPNVPVVAHDPRHIDEDADNLWLITLLKEENKNEGLLQDETDLLHNMGVPLRDEDKPPQKNATKPHKDIEQSVRSHSTASLLWVLGCLSMLLLLAGQYVIFNLETLVKNPAHAARLQAVCSVAACRLPAADITAWTVLNTTHQSSQIRLSGTFSDVSTTLNNQSSEAQLYPNIKVSVYGAENLLGEFVAVPAEYLLSRQSQLAADSRRQILLTVPIADASIQNITVSTLY